MNSPEETPVFDEVQAESQPWPNQEPVVDGIDEVSQDPNFVTDEVPND